MYVKMGAVQHSLTQMLMCVASALCTPITRLRCFHLVNSSQVHHQLCLCGQPALLNMCSSTQEASCSGSACLPHQHSGEMVR